MCCSCVAGNTSVSRGDDSQCDYEQLSAVDCVSYESCVDCVAHSHTQSIHSDTSATVCLFLSLFCPLNLSTNVLNSVLLARVLKSKFLCQNYCGPLWMAF